MTLQSLFFCIFNFMLDISQPNSDSSFSHELVNLHNNLMSHC